MRASAHCETWGLCLCSCFFSFFRFFFSLSAQNVNCATAQSSHPRSFEYLQVLLKSYVSQSLSQWVMCVSCSRLNVVSSLQRLLSNTVPERQAGSGAGSQHEATALLQAFSYDVVVVDKEVHLHFKQLLNPIHISNELSL